MFDKKQRFCQKATYFVFIEKNVIAKTYELKINGRISFGEDPGYIHFIEDSFRLIEGSWISIYKFGSWNEYFIY